MESAESNNMYYMYHGYWTAIEDACRGINELDTTDMAPSKVRSTIYKMLLDLRPYGKFSTKG